MNPYSWIMDIYKYMTNLKMLKYIRTYTIYKNIGNIQSSQKYEFV